MDAKLLELINVQMSFEESQAESLKPVVDETKNSLLKVVLNRVRWDSMRHAAIFQAIIDQDKGQVIWEIDKKKMVKELNNHIRTEKKMIENIRNIFDIAGDANTKSLFQEILTDEETHHRILSRLKEIVDSIDVSKKDWEFFYRKQLQDDWPDF